LSDIKLDDLMNKKTKDGKIEYEIKISDEDRTEIDKIKDSIRIDDNNFINNYGNNIQTEIGKFSQRVLGNLENDNDDDTKELIEQLVFNIEQSTNVKLSFFEKIFGQKEEDIEKRLDRYNNISENVDDIKNELEIYKIRLLKDIAMLDILYEENLKYFKKLEMYIIAGEEKVKQTRNETINNLYQEANKKDDSEKDFAMQLIKDFEKDVDRFEKRIIDMQTSKIIAMQMAPQIKLIQNNNQVLVDKITDSINNVIPLYKSQLIILLGLKSQEDANNIQKGLSHMTNDIMISNSDDLQKLNDNINQKDYIIDSKTLKELNSNLVQTLNNTIKLQENINKEKNNMTDELKDLIWYFLYKRRNFMNKIKYILLAGVLAFTPVSTTFATQETEIEEKTDNIAGDDQPVELEDGSVVVEEYTDKTPEEIVKEEEAKGNEVVVYEDSESSNTRWYILGATSVIAIGLIAYGVTDKKKKKIQ